MAVALVLGGALCLADDRAAALALFTPDIIIATNSAGMVEDGPVPHFVSMHPELFPKWLAERRAAGRPEPETLWCPIGRPVPRPLVCRTVPSWGGSSGLLAVIVAFEVGYDRVVVAGCPLDQSPHFDDRRPWRDGPRYREAWTRRRLDLKDRVRSMSGWTREFVGPPTPEWLAC